MSDDTVACPHCAEPMPKGVPECPACGTLFAAAPAAASTPAPVGRTASADIAERLQALEQWRSTAAALGVELPAVPRWVEARVRRSPDREWIGFLDDVERGARSRSLEALQAWEKRTLARLQRLEAYSIDGRLEREQIEDGAAAARSGEAARALGVVQQVDRVLALKERHLDAARQELERLTELVRDIRALGLVIAYDPKELAEDLEGELRGGRLAPLKQQLRALRLDVVRSLKSSFPKYVASLGEQLAKQRTEGRDVGAQIAELTRSAKAYSEGRPDEAVRRLKVLAEGPTAPPRSGDPRSAGGGPTGPSRTA
ncbi:MAG TPA: hypothetical protein VGX00_04835 [Thermoplasmata archaeon]|nr:hypothetical protein [Thermoplasmata archaeon]